MSRPAGSTDYAPPLIDGDFYAIQDMLTADERGLVDRVRAFAENEVQPLVVEHWAKAEFPHHIVPGLAELGIAGIGYDGFGCPGGLPLLNGVVTMMLARTDPSIGTFYAVHSGIAMGSIYLCGSDEQKERWLPALARMERIGSFALTEPDVGSATSRGMTTTCRREGDEWVLNGQKKWIGNGTFSDDNVVWARDVETDEVKGFVVDKTNPGFGAEKIERKISLRIVQNALITLTDCRVPEADRLQRANSFKDTAKVLRMTRAGVSWLAVGTQMGAYEHALRYAQTRHQFDRPIGGFQLVQDLLVRMLGNVTSTQAMMLQLAKLQGEGRARDEHSALAKAFCTVRMRETVGWARELLGGNGVLIDEHVGRFVGDAEAIYSYEGTREMNTLIVGKAITGLSAFV
ncbi:acyl-CoA dehydrogenase family protein [Methylopila sp. M107]|uniref:acyl-CoA dehydrogenase family protein n=1 Tax=Methylopila sp. M107 TaxID=1101190 RepID=UPI00037391FD|nr:acyl-CoA dehydrogenase family protein [Methylopila sp. M107]